MKKLINYGNIIKSGNTLYAKEFKDLNIKCMECGDYCDRELIPEHGFKIIKSDVLLVNDAYKTCHKLECLHCGCVFTVTIEEVCESE